MPTVTIYDIAHRAKVSPSTVSKVINNYPSIPAATKEKVLKMMDAMGYIPDAGARALSKGTSYNVGVLAFFGTNISPFKHGLFTDILASFQKRMNQSNYDLIFIARNVAGEEGTFYQNCVSRGISGTLLFGDFDDPEIEEVIDSDIPKVAFDYIGDKMTSVYSDNREKMKEMTKHLLSLGHKRIVFVHGEDSGVTRERIAGFKEAILESGLKFTDRMLRENLYTDQESIRVITKNLLRMAAPPTAILYPDDYSCMTGISVIQEAGLSCPGDISCTGFDGLYFGQVYTPSLTTVKQDSEAIGTILAEKLIEAMEKKESRPLERVVVPAKFLPGQSSAAAKN